MKTDARRTRTRARAFTLLEVLMVVVIIGLLAAFVVPNFFGAGDRARVDLTDALVKSGVNGALDLYRAHMSTYPRTDEGGLTALVQRPDDEERAKKWSGPYVKKVQDLKDAWGHDLIYQCPGTYNENGYDLSSAGPDDQEGTDDDLTNWERT
jgi:general secretion pathway protein G